MDFILVSIFLKLKTHFKLSGNKMILHVFLFSAILMHSSSTSVMTQKSPLCNYHTDSLNIKQPSGCSDIFEEALWLMKSYFMHKNKYNDKDWENMRKEFTNYKSKNYAIESLLNKFDDPYTRYISISSMNKKQQQLRGEMIGIGIKVNRKIQLKNYSKKIKLKLNNIFKRSSSIFLSSNYQTKSKNTNNNINNYYNNNDNHINNNNNKRTTGKFFLINLMKKVKIPLGAAYNRLLRHKDSLKQSFSFTSANESPEDNRYFHTQILSPSSLSLTPAPWTARAVLLLQIISPVLAVISISPKTWLIPSISVTAVLATGIAVSRHFSPVEILSVLPDSPCSSAGLRRGDKIIAVNGKHVWWLSVRKIKELLDEGPAGEEVKIAVLRNNINSCSSGINIINHDDGQYPNHDYNNNHRKSHQPLHQLTTQPVPPCPSSNTTLIEYNLFRDIIPTIGVQSALLTHSGLGYMKLKEFSDKTAQEASQTLQYLKHTFQQHHSQAMRGLIIDLRGNPGGTVLSALEIASLFLAKSKPVVHMLIFGKKETYYSLNKQPDLQTPLLLLTDCDTASASEILVAALRDHSRAISMGATTVGKNVAQAMMMLSDGSGLIFTVQSYTSPLGKSLSGGLAPDLPLSPYHIPLDRIRWNEHEKKWTILPSSSY